MDQGEDTAESQVLLGTVAIEPNRWGLVDSSRRPSTNVATWLGPIATAGFDGLELWENHLTPVLARNEILPIEIFNTYVSLDDEDDTDRARVASIVEGLDATGVKFNVGNNPADRERYAQRIARWIEMLPDDVVLLCECHEGISIAENPAIAAAIFAAAGPPERLQAIVHTHESIEHLTQRFEAYGDRISHVHVNYLPGGGPPPLGDHRTDLISKIDLLRSKGFVGSWTIEFVAGVLTDRDHAEPLIAQAAEDLFVLRSFLR